MSAYRRPASERTTFELVLSGCESWDIDSLPDWLPECSEDVFYCLQLWIGPKDGSPHLFDALIATPEGLRAHKERYGRLSKQSQRVLFVFPEYSWAEVDKTMQQAVADCAGADFDESLEKLRKRFSWEYEGYR